MHGRDWLLGSIAAAAVAAILIPAGARAEDRHFTSLPLDVNRNDHIVYAPIFMAKFGPHGGDDIPGIVADWKVVALNSEDVKPDSVREGSYRLLEITEKRDPEHPTASPE